VHDRDLATADQGSQRERVTRRCGRDGAHAAGIHELAPQDTHRPDDHLDPDLLESARQFAALGQDDDRLVA
jgi:hypothetical protein